MIWVWESLMQLDINITPGYDEWHPFQLKRLAYLICHPLVILFNKSLKEGAHECLK